VKNRQYKKLCKKASVIVRSIPSFCDGEEWNFSMECRGVDFVEWDCEPCWDYLVGLFDGDVNTMYSDDFDFGMKWKEDKHQLKSTPKNVFSWARIQKHLTAL
tara:strand:- start:210 stop:515 length:306 start_codon:yes stop_codon:yes gene_type:complete